MYVCMFISEYVFVLLVYMHIIHRPRYVRMCALYVCICVSFGCPLHTHIHTYICMYVNTDNNQLLCVSVCLAAPSQV